MWDTFDKTRPVYIVAGTQSEINRYLYNMHKNEPRKYEEFHFKSVRTAEQLYGLDKIQGFFIGTYEKLPNIDAIKEQIERIKWKMII